MTRKDFAKKYQVDYQLVVDASKRIKESTKRAKNIEFEEGRLGRAVCVEMNYRINRMEMRLKPLRNDYDRLRTICWYTAFTGG